MSDAEKVREALSEEAIAELRETAEALMLIQSTMPGAPEQNLLKLKASEMLALLAELASLKDALELARRYDGPQLRHWLGSQDVVGSVGSERAAAIVHAVLRAASRVSLGER